MLVSNHLDKIFWSFADKALFASWGLVTILLLMNYSSLDDFGVFLIFIGVITYFSTVSDSFALQGIIQFSKRQEDQAKVNYIAISLQLLLLLVLPILLFIIRKPIINWLNIEEYYSLFYYFPLLTFLLIPRTFLLKHLIKDLKYRDFFFVNLSNFGIMIIVASFIIYKNGFYTLDNLILIFFSGSFFSFIISIIYSLKYLELNFNKSRLKVSEYIKFTSTWTYYSLLSSIPKHLDTTLIPVFYKSKDSLELVAIYGAAKSLFRIFDQISEAAANLIYPSAVKNIDNLEIVKSIMTKSLSMIFIFNLVIVVIVQVGGAELIIENLLNDRFIKAIPHLKIMSLAALCIPFTSLILILTAKNELKSIFYISTISTLLSIITFYFLTNIENGKYIALGLVMYYFIMGLISFIIVKFKYGFPIKHVFRGYGDLFNYLKNKKNENY